MPPKSQKEQQFDAISAHINAHINKRFDTLGGLLGQKDGRKVVIAGHKDRIKSHKVGKKNQLDGDSTHYQGALGHSLGVGLAHSQWGDNESWRKTVELIDQKVIALHTAFPNQVSFDHIPDHQARIETSLKASATEKEHPDIVSPDVIYVWGANSTNWNNDNGESVGGGGQAANIQVRDKTTFGIVTTPLAYNFALLNAKDKYLLSEVDSRESAPPAPAAYPSTPTEAKAIAKIIIDKQQEWLKSSESKNAFPDAEGSYPQKDHILGSASHFDWWIFPGYTTNSPENRKYCIPSSKEDPDTRKEVYQVLAKNDDFMTSYKKCLTQYFETLDHWTKNYYNAASLSGVNKLNTPRIQKVVESMAGIGFDKIPVVVLRAANAMLEKHAKLISGDHNYAAPLKKFTDYFNEKFPSSTPPPRSDQSAAANQPAASSLRGGGVAAPVGAPASPAGPKDFRGRKYHENALLRFLVRKFNNESSNIGAAKFVQNSPLHLVAKNKHEEARRLLLTLFEHEKGLMNSKKSPYFTEITTLENFKLTTSDKQTLATEFTKGLSAWIAELQKTNVLQYYAKAFENSQKNVKVSTTPDFDQSQLAPILKDKAKTGAKVPFSENIFKFQLSTTSCQIATAEGLPLINQRGQIGTEFSLNSFCYPNFRESFKRNITPATIENEVTAQFTLALQNLQADITPPKTEGLFTIIPPGAFVRGMKSEDKEAVAKLIVKSLKNAIAIINDSKIKIQFSGSKEINGTKLGGKEILFGWGGVLDELSGVADKDQPFTKAELLSQAQYCKANNIAFQVPMMGEPLGAVGNGASSPRANSAADECLARITGGMHCVTLNITKNPIKVQSPALKTVKSQPKGSTADKQAAFKSQVEAYAAENKAKITPTVKTLLDEQINSQESEPNPKQVYKGCGFKATFDKVGNLVIDEIFDTGGKKRFTKQVEGNAHSEVENDYLTGKTISFIWDEKGWKKPSEMTLEEMVKILHDPKSDTKFSTLSDNGEQDIIQCSKENKNLFVTKSCESAKPNLTSFGDKYDVTEHGIQAIDPTGKIQEESTFQTVCQDVLKSTYDSGSKGPGNFHGGDHAIRTTLLMEELLKFTARNNLINPKYTPQEAILLRYAALFHDSGRYGQDGIDNEQMEKKSADLFTTKMKELFPGQKKLIEAIAEQAIVQKDGEINRYNPLLQSVDVIEVMRDRPIDEESFAAGTKPSKGGFFDPTYSALLKDIQGKPLLKKEYLDICKIDRELITATHLKPGFNASKQPDLYGTIKAEKQKIVVEYKKNNPDRPGASPTPTGSLVTSKNPEQTR